MKIDRLVLNLILLATTPLAVAGVNLDRSIVYFNPDTYHRQDVNVTNPDEDPLYLQTEVYRVENPGSDQEQRLLVANPKEMKLLATPHRALIKQGNKRRVRLINMEKGLTQEKIYRVRFRPMVGSLKNNKQAIKLLVAYEVLVFVRPAKPVFNVDSKISGNKLILTNTGNSNVVIRNMVHCQKKEDCNELQLFKRLYAGQQLSTSFSGKGDIRFGIFDGKNEVQRSISVPARSPESPANNISKI